MWRHKMWTDGYGAVVEYVSQKLMPQQNTSNRKSVRMCRLVFLLFFFFNGRLRTNRVCKCVCRLNSSASFHSTYFAVLCFPSSHSITIGAHRRHTNFKNSIPSGTTWWSNTRRDAVDSMHMCVSPLVHTDRIRFLTCAKNDRMKLMMDLLFLLIWDKTTQTSHRLVHDSSDSILSFVGRASSSSSPH